MKILRDTAAAMLGTGLLFALGCGAQPSAGASSVPGTQPPPGVTNAQNNADMQVVERVSSARCEHEQTCNNIGPDKKYLSHQVCMDQVRGSVANGINAYSCARGIDQTALNSCLSAVRTGDCSFSLKEAFSQPGCGSSSLCIK